MIKKIALPSTKVEVNKSDLRVVHLHNVPDQCLMQVRL